MNTLELVFGDNVIALNWGEVESDRVVEAVNRVSEGVMNYYGGTYVELLDGDGINVSIENTVFNTISPVFVRVPDGNNQPKVQYDPTRDLSTLKFAKTETFQVAKSGEFSTVHEEEKAPKLVGNDNSAPYQFMGGSPGELSEFTFWEVKKHNKRTDCWIVLNRKVYDITEYIRSHPGGEIILDAAGKDGSSFFEKHHPWVNAHALIGRYQVGYLKR